MLISAQLDSVIMLLVLARLQKQFAATALVFNDLKAGTHRPNCWTSEAFGETRTRLGTNIFDVFSCAGSFQSRWTSSAPIHHVTSEEEGCRPSEPLDSLIGGVLENQRGVWEGQNTVRALFFYALCSFPVPVFTRLLHLAQAQNVHATVELTALRSVVFSATSLPNGSDKRQQSGRIKAVGLSLGGVWGP